MFTIGRDQEGKPWEPSACKFRKVLIFEKDLRPPTALSSWIVLQSRGKTEKIDCGKLADCSGVTAQT